MIFDIDVSHSMRRDLVDVMLAVLAIALSMSILAGMEDRASMDLTGAWWLAIAHSAPIAIRRRATRSAFVASATAGIVYLFLGYPMVGLGLSALLMMYTLAVERPRTESLLGLVFAEIGMFASLEAMTDMQFDTMAGNALFLAAMWLIGDSARRRRQQARSEQAVLAHQAVNDERMRIARELHDVVAHSMSVVGVQAGMARMVLDEDPEKARRSLLAIEKASRQAMDEMRRLLRVLRDESSDDLNLAPSPGLGDLSSLVSNAVAGGTPVELFMDGDKPDLTPGVELAAFRVVQEALTNVRRHSPGSAARVRIGFEDSQLVVQVDNDLTDAMVVKEGGHGLVGMRERVELYRGQIESGAQPDGSFRVLVRLPYRAESS